MAAKGQHFKKLKEKKLPALKQSKEKPNAAPHHSKSSLTYHCKYHTVQEHIGLHAFAITKMVVIQCTPSLRYKTYSKINWIFIKHISCVTFTECPE